MELAETCRSRFENWPKNIPREAVIVTKLGESIPFKDFLYRVGCCWSIVARPTALAHEK